MRYLITLPGWRATVALDAMPELRLDPRATILLVVDVQNDFCSPRGFFERHGLDVSPGGVVIERIAALLETVRPLDVPVIFTKSVRSDPQPQRLRPSRPFYGERPFAPGTWGSEIVDALRPQPGELVIEKPRYSAFFATALEQELAARGVDTVALAGVTSNCCIDSTMRDAYYRDLNVLVLEDCVAGFGGEEHLHRATLDNCRLLFGVVAPASDFTAALAGSASTPAAP